MNTRTSLITATSLTATFVALCAAIFSVTGIAKLFAGAAISAGIMASALELGKIVSISFLYQYWKEIPKTLKYYLSMAAVILMIITSAGIYGYLSSAYAKVAATPLALTANIETNQGRVNSIDQDIKRKEDRLNQLITLRSQQETRLDQLVSKSTSGNSSTIRTAQNALNAADKNVTALQNEITNLSAQRDSLTGLNISKRVEIETNGDIGTFVYIAKILGTDLDTVVKWFTLIIVLVFDPLAVALVIAVNFLLRYRINESALAMPTENITEPYKVYDVSASNNTLFETPSEMASETGSDVHEVESLPEQETPISDNTYLHANFNWKDRSAWEHNPEAVKYYDRYLKHKFEG